jgi:exopolyphosphatase/guanosine-5'-triphosphate,3'-diphosphate pyrophosphatase
MWPRADRQTFADLAPSDDGRQAAVIDLGSNSVRLVIYRIEGRALWTVFNEKALAGLGRGLPQTGRLSSEGVAEALTALRRYKAVLQGWDQAELFAAATAAVREASDGPEFLRRIRDEVGLDVKVLSGEMEARYGALGVLAGAPASEGVVGDLGGSSLELTPVAGGRAGPGVTLPLGPFALGAPKPLNLDAARKQVEAKLAGVADRFKSQPLHAVGGSWRNLALLHMAISGYPLHVTHLYEMTRNEALEVARFAARQSRQSLERIQGLSKKRFDTLPYAALVLETLVERLEAPMVVTSAYGVREGMLFDAMSPADQAADPLLAGCDALSRVRGLSFELGEALEYWLKPAFSALPQVFGDRDPILTGAACRLADLGARLHPDHRADVVFEQVLRAPIAGMNHAERAFLACAIFSRYTAATTTPEANVVSRLLTSERRQRARALGAAIRLGCDLSGRNGRLLDKARLSIRDDRLHLTASPGWNDLLLGEQAAKRAATLAGILRLKLHMA